MLLLASLPPEAAAWVAEADDYDEGRRIAGGGPGRGVAVPRQPPDASPAAELSGLPAVMYRLWPPDPPDRWREAAGYFLEFCGEAGLSPERLVGLLTVSFAGFLDGSADGEQGTAADGDVSRWW